MNDGSVKKIEAELFAINFRYHGHDPKKVDLIVACYSKTDSLDGIPVLAVNKFWLMEQEEEAEPVIPAEAPLSEIESKILGVIDLLAVAQNHPPGVESRGFKITHPEKVKGLANRLWSGADFGHVKLSQDGLGQRNTGTQKQGLVEAAHRPGAPDRPADRAQTCSGRFKFTSRSAPRDCAG